MYDIKETSFGFELSFGGRMDREELLAWRSDSEDVVAGGPDSFGVLVNMRDLATLDDDAQEVMVETQHAYRDWGMERSAVLLDSATTKLQFQRLARESGIDEWERYVDDESFDDARVVALDWVENGVEPEE